MRKSFALAAVAMFSGLTTLAPALAFTHHPATKAEREQTRQLNLQSLQAAQSQAPANMQANAGAAPGNDNTDNNTAIAPATQPSDRSKPAPTTPSNQAPAPSNQTPQ